MLRLPFEYKAAVIFGLGIQELVIILIIVIFLFGARAIPGLGKALGEMIKGFRSSSKEIEEKNSKEKVADKEETKDSQE